MRYQFYICKPSQYCDYLVSKSLRTYLAGGERSLDRNDLLLPFDVERLRSLLRVASGEFAGFEPRFRFRQAQDLPLVSVRTEYRKAQEVADALEMCLGDAGLNLFDCEMECCVNIDRGERSRFILARLAHQRLKIALQKKSILASGQCCAWAKYFQLGQCFYPNATIDTAIMILRGTLCDAVKAADEILRDALADDEILYCDNGCFVVENKACGYKVRFVIEGIGKSAQYMGWIEDGNVRLELLRRMSLYHAIKGIGELGEGEESHVRSRLYFEEEFQTRGGSRNPVDRFVDSYKVSYRLKKLNLDIIYGTHPQRNNSEFVFYMCDEHDLGWDAWKTSSFFTMSEEQAAPLLAIFESVIPYYYDYYYDKFHFRKEEVTQIQERIKIVREQLIENPCNPVLGKILERLLNSNFAWQYLDGRTATRFDEEEKREILSQNRFRVLSLLDFFSWWLSGQRNALGTCFDGFYVEGP